MNVVSHDTTRRPAASCRRCETGVDPIGTAAAYAATGPVGGTLYLGAEVIGDMLSEIFASSPEGDDRPMPFHRTEGGGGPRPLDQHPEWIEAEARIVALADLAVACGLDPSKVGQIVTALRARLWAGIASRVAGDFSPMPTGAVYYIVTTSERPTRGQVRAWLGAFATELGKRCGDQHLSALSDAVAAPLTTRVAPSSVVLWAVGAIAAGVALLAVMR